MYLRIKIPFVISDFIGIACVKERKNGIGGLIHK
jgi:hypothetical protein